MASAAAQLFVQVTANVRGLIDGFDAARQAATKLGDGVDKAAGVYVDASGRMRDASGKFVAAAGGVGGAITSLGTIVKGTALGELLADGIRSAGDAMVTLGARSLQLAGELEQNKVAFTTMLKSGEAADKMLRDLATFAASTPFELRGLTDAAKKLIAFGFSSQSIIPIMTSLGDAIGGIGGGQEAIGQVTMALGQMAAKGKVSAEEMNQFAEKGINTWKYVAQAIGKSVPEAMKLAEKGAIDAATAIPAILQGMSKEFGGMMEKQSKTWNGALSNFQDATDQAMTKIGDAIIHMGLGELIQKMTAGVNNLAAAFETGRIIPAIQAAEAAVLGLATAFTAYLLPGARLAGASMVTAFTAGAAAAAPFIALAAAVAFAAYPIIKNWQEIKWGLQDLFDYGMGKMTQFYNFGSGIVRDFANNWLTGMNYIAGIIRSVLGDTIANKLIGGVKAMGSAFTGFAAKASPAIQGIGNGISWAASQFKDTWGDAMASAKLVTVDLFKTTAAGKVDVAKITAELLGLKKGQMAASDAAKKHHETAEQAARRHARELKAVEAQYMRNLQTYLAQEAVTYKLGDGLKKLEADQARLGLAFDAAGAKAELYRSVLSQIEQAFGKASRQAMATRTAIAELQAASDNGGAALAKAYEIIGKAGAGLDLAQRQAEALGQAFDRNAEGVKLYEQAIKDLVEMGLKPGNKAYDEAIAKLNGLRSAAAQAVNANVELGKAIGDVAGPIGTILNGATDMFELFGIKIPDGAKDAISGFVKFGQVIGSVAGAIPMLTQALAGLNVAIATNPIGLLIIAIGAGLYLWSKTIGFIIDRFNEANEAGAAAMRNTAAEITAARQEAFNFAADISLIPQHFALVQEQIKGIVAIAGEAFSTLRSAAESGLKDATLAFMAGASNYGEILRTKLREGITQAVLDAIIKQQMMGNIEKLIKQITDAFASGNLAGIDALYKQLEEKLIKATEAAAGTMGVVAKALGEVPEQFAAMANKATSSARSMRGAMEERNREAMGSYHQNMLGTVQRLANAGAQDPGSRLHNQYLVALDEANKASNDLRRMATGGLVTGPTLARMGEGGRPEAVLPLNENVYRQIGQGIAAAREGGGQAVVSVNYYGSGKWTREDAEGLGRLLVSELRALGVRA